MAAKHACPHCGSLNHRILADQMGRIGWCCDCHRTWEPAPCRPAPIAAVASAEVLSPHESRHG